MKEIYNNTIGNILLNGETFESISSEIRNEERVTIITSKSI
jgi:hypothetical protein